MIKKAHVQKDQIYNHICLLNSYFNMPNNIINELPDHYKCELETDDLQLLMQFNAFQDDEDINYSLDDDAIDQNGDNEFELTEELPEETGSEKIDEPSDDKSLATLRRIDDYIHCFDMNSDGSLVVTGYNCYVLLWDTATGEVLQEINEDMAAWTVTFSHDDKYLAIKWSWSVHVWSIQEKKLMWKYDDDEIRWLLWHHSTYDFFAGFDSGEIFMWKFPKRNCKLFPVNETVCTCGVVLPNGTQLAAGYRDGSVRIWDLKWMTITAQLYGLINDTDESVSKLSLSHDAKLILVKRDYLEPLLLTTEDCDVVSTFESNDDNSINFAILYSDAEISLVATGDVRSGEIYLWDVDKNGLHLRHKASITPYILNMSWSSNAMLFAASSTKDTIYIINGRTGQVEKSLATAQRGASDFKISKDSKKLLSISTHPDYSAKIYEISTSFSDVVL